jgi:hypothetical protein
MVKEIVYNDTNAQFANTDFNTKSVFKNKIKYFGMNTLEVNRLSQNLVKNVVVVTSGYANN